MDDFGYFPLDPALRFVHPHWDGCIAGRRLIGVRSDGDILGCLSLGDALRRGGPAEGIAPGDLGVGYVVRPPPEQGEVERRGACVWRALPWSAALDVQRPAHSATGDIGCNPYCIRALETEDILAGIDVADSTDAGARIQEEEK